MATPIRPAAAPPARSPLPLPPAPAPHHDTALTLALALPHPPPPPAISPRPAPRPSSLTAGTPPTPCSEGGKQFHSWKALFGHMRCHPERQWRGMTPRRGFCHPHQAAVVAADLQFTEQERETATSLLMLRQGETGKAKMKVSCGASSTSASSPPARCVVCARGFAAGGHKRCHWDKTTCAERRAAAVATSSGGCIASPTSSSSQAAAPATALDLNLPPPGMPPFPKTRKREQGGILDATLDLKLGF